VVVQSDIALPVPEFCLVFRCHLVVEHFSLAVEVKHVLERFRFNVSKGQLSLICRLFRKIALLLTSNSLSTEEQ
jgi:hypothetical protein